MTAILPDEDTAVDFPNPPFLSPSSFPVVQEATWKYAPQIIIWKMGHNREGPKREKIELFTPNQTHHLLHLHSPAKTGDLGHRVRAKGEQMQELEFLVPRLPRTEGFGQLKI